MLSILPTSDLSPSLTSALADGKKTDPETQSWKDCIYRKLAKPAVLYYFIPRNEWK